MTPAVAVVIPAFNEEKLIVSTLEALEAQVFDDFFVVVVDNNSSDRTAELVRDYAKTARVPIYVYLESEKGTGCAADSGVRDAIERGASFIARTDADSVADPAWLKNLLAPLAAGKRLVGGIVRFRSDEGFSAALFNAVGVLRPVRRAVANAGLRMGVTPKTMPIHVIGNNMAIDAATYLAAGGFPRSKIDDIDEDKALQLAVTAAFGDEVVAQAEDAVIYTSGRRFAAYGLRNTMKWYARSGFRPQVIDVR